MIDNQSITAQLRYIKDLSFDILSIPTYQRPYCWTRDNVRQLLECILANLGKNEYRIGSIILNPNNSLLDIVDGQQRLTTITLISKVLNLGIDLPKALYRYKESKHRIYDNSQFIETWVATHLDNEDLRREFGEFLKNKCSVSEIIVPDLSEAFQMFDSQNGRGKELEAHNLLKAFHLRAIDSDESKTFVINSEKVEIDKNWENIVADKHEKNTGVMSYLLNGLYRTRQWCRNVKHADEFTKKNLSEYKGIQIKNGRVTSPFQNSGLLLFLYAKGCGSEAICKRYSEEPITPGSFMSIVMQIVNGSLFFEYVNTYYRLYKRLFDDNNDNLKAFRNDYQNYCLYKKHEGAGDTYVRDVYISLLIFVFDRFGEEGVKAAYKRLYVSVYRKRLYNMSVYYETMAKYPSNLFLQLANAKDIEEVDYRVLCDDDSKREKKEEIKIRYFREEVAEFVFRCNKDYPYNFSIELDEDGEKAVRTLMDKCGIKN